MKEYHKLEKDLVLRYLENRCSPEEAEAVIYYVKTAPSQDEMKQSLQEIWNSGVEVENEDVDFDQLLERIHHSIISQGIKTYMPHNGETHQAGTLYKAIRFLGRVAAVLFIPLLAYTLIVRTGDERRAKGRETLYTEVQVPAGVRTAINLPDGSRVWLNSGSWIKYPASFDNKSRKVDFKGEAFFKVAHNPNLPFIVSSGDIKVNVLGTAFNLENYGDQQSITTTLVEGRVELQKQEEGGLLKILTTMEPQEMLRYDKTSGKAMLHKNVDTYKYTSWMEGKTVFTNDPLDEVFDKLARRYNVEIEYSLEKLSKYTFTATFEDEEIEQVLDLVSLAVPLEYSVEKRRQNTDNTFTRKNYRIKLSDF